MISVFGERWGEINGSTMRWALTAIVIGMLGCGRADDPWPEPWRSQEVVIPCGPAPPPPPPNAISTPTDIGSCLPQSFPRADLPVEVKVSTGGRMVDIAFYSPCSGETYQVAPAIEACIRDRLSRWEWLSWPRCGGSSLTDEFGVDHLVALRPTAKPNGVREARSLAFTTTGCGGGV